MVTGRWLNARMRTRRVKIEQWLLGLALLLALLWNLAEAREIREVALHGSATGTRAEITLAEQAEYRVLRLAAPERLVLDVLHSTLSPRLALPAGKGVVRSVRSGQPEPHVSRIVFDLQSPVVAIGPHVEWRDGKPVLILQWPDDGIASLVAPPAAQMPPANTPGSTPGSTAAVTSVPATQTAPPATAATTPAAPPAASGTTAVTTHPASVPAAPARLPEVIAPTAQVPGLRTPVQSAPTASAGTPVRSVQQMQRGLRPIVVAIDAGHGGQDPGAIGPAGTREKDITLSVARELARQVNATPGLRAYLTRDTDRFIPLAERYQMARRAQADVFVSIHADAAENRNASGSSVYVLSLRGASSQAARWLADRENASDLVGGVRLRGQENTLASVLLDLSQSATQRASEQIANEVLRGLRNLGKTHKNQVERANFVVLRSPDVPSMLVETAFISNPAEEQRLRQRSYQQQLARAVLNGIHQYFTRVPPPGTHYAARRDAAGGGGTASP